MCTRSPSWRPAIAGLITGLWPAKQASRFNLVESLKEGSSAAGTSRHVLRNLLVVGQVSLSLIVLVSAGLFLHSLRQMQTVALGMRTDRLIMMSVDLGLQQYDDVRGRRFLEDLLARAEALPGVTSATMTVHVPLDYGMQFNDVAIDGVIPGTKDSYLSIAYTLVGPRFLETTGALLARGRSLIVRTMSGRERWPWSTRRWRRSCGRGRTAWAGDSGSGATGTGSGSRRRGPRWQVPDARRGAAALLLPAAIAGIPRSGHAAGADRRRPVGPHGAAAATCSARWIGTCRCTTCARWRRTCVTASSA